MRKIILIQLFILFCTFSLPPEAAWAHGDGKKDPHRKISTEEKSFGREGDPKRVNRTIAVDMSDRMRYTPMEIRVKRGDTVRFVVRNSGGIMHEMVLGTMPDLKDHAEIMKKFPDMEHDAPHMAHVKPGQSSNMVWQFTRAGEFYYGCLMPGHFEAGMVGKVIVR